MNLFPQGALNDGVRKREVFGWAMYDFANSGYTTVVLTAVFSAYFVGVVAGGADWATLAWTLAISASSLIVMLTMPAIGAYADLKAAKKRLLALSTVGCVIATAALAFAGRGDVWLAVAAVLLSHTFYSYGESLIAAFLPEIARDDAMGRLGLELRLPRRHAGARPGAGLRGDGAGARRAGHGIRAGRDADHRRGLRPGLACHLRLAA